MTDKPFGWVPFMQTPRRQAALDRLNAASDVAEQASAALRAAEDSAVNKAHLASNATYVRLRAEYDAADRAVQAANELFSWRRAWADFLEQQSASCRVFLGGRAGESAAFSDRRVTISVPR